MHTEKLLLLFSMFNSSLADKFRDSLRMVAVPLISASACEVAYNGTKQAKTVDLQSNICTFLEGSDVDAGDEGGPLFCNRNGRAILVGVASWGLKDRFETYPFVYSKVSFYQSWIANQTSGT